MAALPRRKSLKLRLVELREGKLGSLGRSVGVGVGQSRVRRIEKAHEERGQGRGDGSRGWRVIIRPLGVAGQRGSTIRYDYKSKITITSSLTPELRSLLSISPSLSLFLSPPHLPTVHRNISRSPSPTHPSFSLSPLLSNSSLFMSVLAIPRHSFTLSIPPVSKPHRSAATVCPTSISALRLLASRSLYARCRSTHVSHQCLLRGMVWAVHTSVT